MYTNKFIQLNSTSSTVDSSSYIRKLLHKLNKIIYYNFNNSIKNILKLMVVGHWMVQYFIKLIFFFLKFLKIII
jgi:hypothetical protein